MIGQDIKAALGKNIKFLRTQRHFSQALLAEKSDISITFLSNIERGLKYPKPTVLAKISESLNVDVHELFKMNFEPKSAPVAVTDDRKKLINQLSKVMTAKVNDAVNKALNNSMEKVFRDFKK